MNLLVTGGDGFIGSNLVHALVDLQNVEKLVTLGCLTYAGRLENLAGLASHPKHVFERVNLRSKPAVQEVVRKHAITHVLHLAAESHVDRSITGPTISATRMYSGRFTFWKRVAPPGETTHGASAFTTSRRMRFTAASGRPDISPRTRLAPRTRRTRRAKRRATCSCAPAITRMAASGDNPLLEQLWPAAIPRKAHSSDHPERR